LYNCLQGVCIRGTAAQVFKNTPYPVAGKTGTAQVANRNQGYNTNIYQASFAGFFPADHPKYTCVVVIKNKAGAILHHGSDVAAPVFKEIADRLYSTFLRKSPATLLVNNTPADSIQWHLGGNKNDLQRVAQALHIPVTDSSHAYDQWGDISGTLQKGTLKARLQSPKIMPSLKGLGLKDALLLGESNGLQMKVSGKGKVISQSITAGEPIQKKQVVQIQLSEQTNPDR
jgi:cell division protein FtsI (penicillin-binding protein 3)